MPDTLARAAVQLARFAAPALHRASPIADQWQAHLDAGRIGNPAPAAPETIARREENARLFARLRQGAAA